jgi:hypothetical protein
VPPKQTDKQKKHQRGKKTQSHQKKFFKKKAFQSQAPRLMPVILATQEMEIRTIVVQCQAGQKLSETPSQSISWA